MAVREENVARTPGGVKGYATDCGGIFTATTKLLVRGLPRFEAKAAVVEFPMVRFPERRPSGSFDRAQIVRAPHVGDSADVRLAKHLDPICQAELAFLQWSWTVE